MQDDGCKLTPFTAYEPQRPTRTSYYGNVDRGWTRKRPRVKTKAGSMMAKICLCMLILAAAVLVQALVLRPTDEKAVEAAADSGTSGGTEEDDVLGRLRFVESGGVKSVFAVSQRWALPVSASSSALLSEDTMLRLTAKPGSDISLAAAGEVRAIGTDATLGDYVLLAHGNDLESCYYNVSSIRVEEGQPLSAGDTLGKVAEDGTLYLTVTQTGEKQDPSLYLNLEE